MRGLLHRLQKIEKRRGERWFIFGLPADEDTRRRVDWYERRGYNIGCVLWQDEDAPDWFDADMTVRLDWGE